MPLGAGVQEMSPTADGVVVVVDVAIVVVVVVAVVVVVVESGTDVVVVTSDRGAAVPHAVRRLRAATAIFRGTVPTLSVDVPDPNGSDALRRGSMPRGGTSGFVVTRAFSA